MAKVLVSMPDDLLGAIDREAEVRGTSRSAFLQSAARRELGGPSRAVIDEALERGRAALVNAVAFESADLIRRDRRRRDAADRRR
jgi:metal-responsive CopG/Arc/MetJ family transcriptional regulator